MTRHFYYLLQQQQKRTRLYNNTHYLYVTQKHTHTKRGIPMMMMTSSSSSLSVRATPKTGIIAGFANDKRKTAVKNNNKNTDDGLWNAKIAFDDDDDDANTTNEKETQQQHKGMMSTRRRQLAMSAAVASVALSVGRPMEAQALSLKGKNKNGVYWIEPKVRHAYPLCFVFLLLLLLLLLASTHVFCLLRTTEQRHGDVSIHREIRR